MKINHILNRYFNSLIESIKYLIESLNLLKCIHKNDLFYCTIYSQNKKFWTRMQFGTFLDHFSSLVQIWTLLEALHDLL